jgi:hypothetical protein
MNGSEVYVVSVFEDGKEDFEPVLVCATLDVAIESVLQDYANNRATDPSLPAFLVWDYSSYDDWFCVGHDESGTHNHDLVGRVNGVSWYYIAFADACDTPLGDLFSSSLSGVVTDEECTPEGYAAYLERCYPIRVNTILMGPPSAP